MSSNEAALRRSLLSYLRRTGWEPISEGSVGQLWTVLRDPDAGRIAVPNEFESSSFEFQAVLDRLGRYERKEPAVVLETVEEEFLDVQNYRIADAFVVEDSAVLEGAATVITAARQLTRAAGTTARKPKAKIGSNFSEPGDEVANRARLAHTRHGSFILPVVIPVEPLRIDTSQLLSNDVVLEPSERRLTRTLATALGAINSIAVQPDREPGPDDIRDLVQSGVSREMVNAVRSVASDESVQVFSANFRWSPSVPAPGGVPKQVTIPDAAAPLLNRVARKLSTAKSEPDISISGQIIQIRYVQGEPGGDLSIYTERGKRTVEIRVPVSEAVIREATQWMRDRRAVLVRGVLNRDNANRLKIDDPTHVAPIDRLYVEGKD